MPTAIFQDLDAEKKAMVISAGLAEFAQFGYENSSTNRIVKRAGISKGSLFQYFQSKEELYFYILDGVTAEMLSSLEAQFTNLPKDLFQRVTAYAEAEFAWYLENPDECNLLTKAFMKSASEIYRKAEARYGMAGLDLYNRLLEDIDAAQLKWDRRKTADILKWFLKGFNEEFLSRTHSGLSDDIDSVRRAYVQQLTAYLSMLKEGLVR